METHRKTRVSGENKRAKAQDIITSLADGNVIFLKTKVKDRILCSFPSELVTEKVREHLMQNKHLGIHTYDGRRNKSTSFYATYKKVNMESVLQEPSTASISTAIDDAAGQRISESSEEATEQNRNPDETFLHEMRTLGIGVKTNNGEGVCFYTDGHREIFEAVFGKFTKGRRLSIESGKKIRGLLGEVDDPSVLIDDLDFCEWMLKAEGYAFDLNIEIITEDANHSPMVKPRTAPFRFKRPKDAQKAFTFAQKIGLNPEWQPNEPHNFWLIQREAKKRKDVVRSKMHPVTKALQDLGVPGHKSEDADYWSQNSLKTGYCILLSHKVKEEEKRRKFVLEKVEQLSLKLPNYRFSATGMGIRYEKIESNETPTEKIENGEQFLKMMTSEMWQYLLGNAPQKEQEEFLKNHQGYTNESRYKKVLEEIQNNYVLVNRDNPMIPGIRAMKSEDVKEISDFLD